MKIFEIENTTSKFVRNASNIIDNVYGLGEVPDNRNVDYLGLKVKMKPSVFLRLAAPLNKQIYSSIDFIKNHIKEGGKIASPWLDIKIPMEWQKNNFKKPAQVLNHEGRNRMHAIKDIFGDVPVETHLFFSGGLRRQHITDEWIKQLNTKLIPEKSKNAINGVFFEVI